MRVALALLTIGLGIALAAPGAQAISQSHLTVVSVGSIWNGTQVCVTIVPNPDNCAYDCVFFKDARELGKVVAIATAAHVSRDTVRADYNQDGSGICTGYALYIGQ